MTAAPEDVLVARPAECPEAAGIGHLIGNLHRDIDAQETASSRSRTSRSPNACAAPASRFIRSAPFRGPTPGGHRR